MPGEDLIQRFGYSEMYEWETVPQGDRKLGRFVTFSKDDTSKIVCVNKDSQQVIGVTTVNSTVESDNPNEWKYKNICNEYGDLYLRKEKLAVGEKVYDQLNEINYIRTRPWEHFIPINNKYYDEKQKYVKRTSRIEWVRVNLMGKCIVHDGGTCKPGEYCTPYTGKMKENFGTAVPAVGTEKNQYYVLERLSENTILIFYK